MSRDAQLVDGLHARSAYRDPQPVRRDRTTPNARSGQRCRAPSLRHLRRHRERKTRPILRFHGQHHAFLGFADPNFGVAETGILEGRAFEPNLSPEFRSHLANGAREAPCTTIRDCVKQIFVTGLHDDIEHHLFRDRVANLYSAAAESFAFGGEFGRAKRRSVNPIASRASADRNDVIAGLGFFLDFINRNQPYVAAINQRITQESIIETNRTINRRNSIRLP